MAAEPLTHLFRAQQYGTIGAAGVFPPGPTIAVAIAAFPVTPKAEVPV